MASTAPRLLLVITEDWYFWSHRLDLARAARNAGMEVLIATRVKDHETRILQEGFRLFPIRLRRRSRNPVHELHAILELIQLYRAQRPDIVHHVAIKPILYGLIAARVAQVPSVLNAFAGLGHIFIAKHWKARFLCAVLERALKWAGRSSHALTIFQNEDDRDHFVRKGIIPGERSRIIRGAGVDTTVFRPWQGEEGDLVVMLASRMLWDKGVGEFVAAAQFIRQQGVKARFVLVGDADVDNPARINPSCLRQWHEEGVVEWWGHQKDMPHALGVATVVVLPSYREGLPKVLLEAAACGKPLVATDVPGCREIVRHGVNGFLVPPRDPHALANSLITLLHDGGLRARMGANSRECAVRDFSVERVVTETLKVYQELLGHHPLPLKSAVVP